MATHKHTNSTSYEHIILGFYAAASVAVNQYVNNRAGVPLATVLWYCDVAMMLVALGFFLRSARLMTVVLATAVPAQFLWIIDFVLTLGGGGFGRTEAIGTWGPGMLLSSLHLHVVLIPLAAYGVYRYGLVARALPGIWIAIVTLLGLTAILAPPQYNINCVAFDCDAADPGSGYGQHFIGMVLSWIVSMSVWFMVLRYSARKWGIFRVV